MFQDRATQKNQREKSPKGKNRSRRVARMQTAASHCRALLKGTRFLSGQSSLMIKCWPCAPCCTGDACTHCSSSPARVPGIELSPTFCWVWEMGFTGSRERLDPSVVEGSPEVLLTSDLLVLSYFCANPISPLKST